MPNPARPSGPSIASYGASTHAVPQPKQADIDEVCKGLKTYAPFQAFFANSSAISQIEAERAQGNARLLITFNDGSPLSIFLLDQNDDEKIIQAALYLLGTPNIPKPVFSEAPQPGPQPDQRQPQPEAEPARPSPQPHHDAHLPAPQPVADPLQAILHQMRQDNIQRDERILQLSLQMAQMQQSFTQMMTQMTQLLSQRNIQPLPQQEDPYARILKELKRNSRTQKRILRLLEQRPDRRSHRVPSSTSSSSGSSPSPRPGRRQAVSPRPPSSLSANRGSPVPNSDDESQPLSPLLIRPIPRLPISAPLDPHSNPFADSHRRRGQPSPSGSDRKHNAPHPTPSAFYPPTPGGQGSGQGKKPLGQDNCGIM